MITELPAWTRKNKALSSTGQDVLGLLNEGTTIMDYLLPGLTGGTLHPRYYSFLCWTIERSRKWADPKNANDQTVFIRAMETLFLYATYLHEHDRSVSGAHIGGDTTDKLIQSGAKILPLTGAKVFDRATAFDSQYYKPSMQQLYLLRPEGRFFGLTERGKVLAAVFHESVKSQVALLEKIIQKPTVDRKDVQRVASVLCPCTLGKQAREREVLRNLLFASVDEPQKAELQRRDSLLLFMVWVDAESKRLDPDWWFPAACHNLRIKGKRFAPPPSLREATFGWATYEHRTLLQIALWGLWAAFLAELQTAPGWELSTRQVVTRWMKDIRDSDVYDKVLKRGTKGTADMTISELARHLSGSKDLFESSPALTTLEDIVARTEATLRKAHPQLNEEKLAQQIDEEIKGGRQYIAAYSSLLLWLMMILRWRGFDAEPYQYSWTWTNGGERRLSIATLQEDAGLLGEMKIQDALVWMLDHYVVEQHLLAAGERFRDYHDVSRFRISEGGIRLISDIESDKYRGTQYSANYARAATRLLEELGLFKKDSHKNGAELTGEGTRYLAGSLPD